MEAAASASIVEDLMESWPLTVPVLSVRTILVSLQDHCPRPYNSGQ